MFLGHIIQHVVLDPRDGGTLLAACRTGPPRPDGVPLDRPRPHVGGGSRRRPPSPRATPTGARSTRCSGSRPGHADEPGAWYAGGSPQGLFRTEDDGDTWAPVAGWNDHPRWGDWAEWPDVEGTPDGSMLHSVIVDPRDARPPLHRALRRRRVRVHRRRRRLGAAQRRAARPTSCPTRTPSSATTRTASACTRSGPTGSTSRTTAASTGSTDPTPRGCASATTCRATSATSASRSSCTRAIPTPRGCSRWTAPTCGRAPAPTAARRSTSPATPASRGRGRTAGCPTRGWFTVKRQAMTLDDRDPGRRLLRHDVRRGVGQRRRGRDRGPGSSSTCRRSTPSSRRDRGDRSASRRRCAATRATRRWCRPTAPRSARCCVDLDRQFPGLRFRVVDEQGRLRKHVNVWLDGERVPRPVRRPRRRRRGRDHAGPLGRLISVTGRPSIRSPMMLRRIWVVPPMIV